VVAHKRPPALRRHAVAWRAIEVRRRILANGARRDLQAEFEPQFVGHALLTPRQIVARHLPDEPLQLHGDRWSARARCAAPEQVAVLAPPSLKRLRLYHRQSRWPIEPLRQPNQDETGGVAGALWRDVSFLIER
jgi:hypothetical protein